MRFHDAEEVVGRGDSGGVIEGRAEDRDETSRARAGKHVVGRDGEPALHFGRGPRIAWHPLALRTIGLHEIDQNGVGIRKGVAAIIDRRHLSERAELAELPCLVRAIGHVEIDGLVGQTKQGEHQFDRWQ